MPTPTPAPFSRLHAKDTDTERVVQDLYDKLAQVQAQLTQHSTQINQMQTTKPKGQ
jgi:hypothetical protein